MKERPILFSGPMVRALLDGRKTQTRRVVKAGWRVEHVGKPEWWRDAHLVHKPHCQRQFCEQIDTAELACGGYELTDKREDRSPHGAPGDRLWVRETWRTEELETEEEGEIPPGTDGVRFQANGAFEPIENTQGASERWVEAHRPDGGRTSVRPWRSPRFMPRWASRITLELTAVRVERLQDISEADANLEGSSRWGSDNEEAWAKWSKRLDPSARVASYRGAFAGLWDSLNAKRAPWASNPWVWVLELKRVGT